LEKTDYFFGSWSSHLVKPEAVGFAKLGPHKALILVKPKALGFTLQKYP